MIVLLLGKAVLLNLLYFEVPGILSFPQALCSLFVVLKSYISHGGGGHHSK